MYPAKAAAGELLFVFSQQRVFNVILAGGVDNASPSQGFDIYDLVNIQQHDSPVDIHRQAARGMELFPALPRIRCFSSLALQFPAALFQHGMHPRRVKGLYQVIVYPQLKGPYPALGISSGEDYLGGGQQLSCRGG